MHKPFVITKELDQSTPLLYRCALAYVRLSDVARFFGATFTAPANLPGGAPITLTFPRTSNAAIDWGD